MNPDTEDVDLKNGINAIIAIAYIPIESVFQIDVLNIRDPRYSSTQCKKAIAEDI